MAVTIFSACTRLSGYPRDADRSSEQAGELYVIRCRHDRIADADIDVEREAGGDECRGHRHPNPAVLVLVADHDRGGASGFELHSVVELPCRDPLDARQDLVSLVGQRFGLEVDVTRRPTHIERGEENSSLEDEVCAVSRARQPFEERFEDVELQQFLGWPAGCTCLALEIEKSATCRRVP